MKVYTTQEAAEYLGDIKQQAVMRHIIRKKIKAEYKGGVYLIEEAELQRFQKERRKPGRPEIDVISSEEPKRKPGRPRKQSQSS